MRTEKSDSLILHMYLLKSSEFLTVDWTGPRYMRPLVVRMVSVVLFFLCERLFGVPWCVLHNVRHVHTQVLYASCPISVRPWGKSLVNSKGSIYGGYECSRSVALLPVDAFSFPAFSISICYEVAAQIGYVVQTQSGANFFATWDRQ